MSALVVLTDRRGTRDLLSETLLGVPVVFTFEGNQFLFFLVSQLLSFRSHVNPEDIGIQNTVA